jgi:MEDS: MEthanogen/methylotroph, DcmR Sensory domain
MDALPRHQCLIYEGSPAKHLRGLASTLIENLKKNRRCLYLNNPIMVALMRSYLAAAGLELTRELERGALVLSSGQGHLVDGQFDGDRMLAMLNNSVNEALRDGFSGLWATGDMTWEFGNEKSFVKLLDYERGLEELFEKHISLSGVCQYHVDTLPVGVVEQGLHIHKSVYVNEILSRINPHFLSHESLAGRSARSPAQVRQMIESVYRSA